MPAPAITVLKNNVPWGPFTRAQIDEGLARGDFTLRYLAHATGLKEWLPLGEVLDYVDHPAEARPASLPPVPEPRELPPLPVSPLAGPRATPPKPTAPPIIMPPPVVPAPAATLAPPSVFPPVVMAAQSTPPLAAAPAVAQSLPAVRIQEKPAPVHPDQLITAPFVSRVIAFVIDGGILCLPLLGLFLLGALGIEFASWWEKLDAETRGQRWELLDRNFRDLAYLVVIGLGWIYSAFYESSPAQATLGKRWMGLKVTDAEGRRIGFLRATGRYAGKYLSALPCFLGFILPLFSSRGQALHDLLADTRVVRE